jgi:hypothetical protein
MKTVIKHALIIWFGLLLVTSAFGDALSLKQGMTAGVLYFKLGGHKPTEAELATMARGWAMETRASTADAQDYRTGFALGYKYATTH